MVKHETRELKKKRQFLTGRVKSNDFNFSAKGNCSLSGLSYDFSKTRSVLHRPENSTSRFPSSDILTEGNYNICNKLSKIFL